MSVVIEKHLFLPSQGIPNHPLFPLLIYRSVLDAESISGARDFFALFKSRNWGNAWQNGVFPYHHFHSNTHEVLGVFSGRASVGFGGEEGVEKEIGRGDVVVIPAGVGHKALSASEDFGVVGAYPEERSPDLLSGETPVQLSLAHAISLVPIPEQDPVYGKDGPLFAEWQNHSPSGKMGTG